MVTFAIVGAGWIGGIHADRLQRCRGARLGVVCDAEPERARGLADRFGCGVAATVEDACRRADAVMWRRSRERPSAGSPAPGDRYDDDDRGTMPPKDARSGLAAVPGAR